MTPAEKKRLVWILIAIFFFFANLIVVAVMLLQGMPAKHISAGSEPGATSQQ